MILLVMRYMLLSVEPLEHTTLQFFTRTHDPQISNQIDASGGST